MSCVCKAGFTSTGRKPQMLSSGFCYARVYLKTHDVTGQRGIFALRKTFFRRNTDVFQGKMTRRTAKRPAVRVALGVFRYTLCKSIAKIRNVPFPRPCGATGNDAQKLHAPAFAHFRGAVRTHEVLYDKKQTAGNGSLLESVRITQRPLRPLRREPAGRGWTGKCACAPDRCR